MLETDRPIAIKNSTHFCGFFKTIEEAEEHLKACQVEREGPYGASLYGPPNRPCIICFREELLRYQNQRPFCVTFPYGTNDGIKEDVTVIQFLDYVKTAKENS